MKKILFVYPHNFLEQNMGTNIRIYALAKELNRIGYKIDLYALKNFVSVYDSFEDMNKKESLINQLFLYDYKEIKRYQKRKERKKKIFKFIYNNNEELENWVTPNMLKQFKHIVSSSVYSHIVMFYTYTADLLAPSNFSKTPDTQTIYFMEDLLSIGEYISKRSEFIGKLLDSELKRIANFDKVACISFDEKIFVEKLSNNNKQFYFLPHIINKKDNNINKFKQHLKVTFVGYDNLYNIEGINWFLDHVYPLLSKKLEITFVGKITKHITSTYPNIVKINFIEDLNELYLNTDIIICPLLNGTGMKIKVIEAMSYGLPIVCTPRGVDGLPDKTMNGCFVTNDPSLFASAINKLAENYDFYESSHNQICNYFDQVLDWNKHKKTLINLFEDKNLSTN